jgi:hypothetical protein
MKKLIILFAVLAGFGVSSFAQNSVTTSVTSSAKIIAPLAVTKTNNLAFGSIVPGALASTVTISTAASPTRTPTGTTTCIGTFTNVKFDVTGEPLTTYSITYPATVVLAGTAPMTATLSCSAAATGNLISVGTFYIGASLAVGTAAAQTAGSYSNAGFNVTVAYE